MLRLAFVTERRSVYTNELLIGLTRASNPLNGRIVREFHWNVNEPLPEALINWQPDGIVAYVDGRDARTIDLLLEATRSVVTVSRSVPRHGLAVVIGSANDIYAAAHRHFAELGIENVTQFVLAGQHSQEGLGARYRSWCAATGVHFSSFAGSDEEDFRGAARCGFDPKGVTSVSPLTESWLRQLPRRTGIFTQTSHAGWYLARYCQLLNIAVPERIAILGSDDFDVATKSYPPVSSFRIPAREIGERAGSVLGEILRGAPVPREIIVVGGIELIERDSTLRRQHQTSGIDEALAYIEAFACSGVSVNDVLAETQTVSRMTFHKRFVDRTGATPGEWILNRRMSEARRLLADSEVTVGSISSVCGFSDALYFYKVFRKHHGVSPSDYRRFTQARLREEM